jgi:hypothetical protein
MVDEIGLLSRSIIVGKDSCTVMVLTWPVVVDPVVIVAVSSLAVRAD